MIEGAVRSRRSERAAQLYRTFGPAVYRRCLKLLRDRDAARDATQEVFVRLLKDMDRLEETATALPWVFRVATNHCLNVLRDRSRRQEEELCEWDLAEPGAAATYPERRLAHTVLSSFDEGTQAVAVGVLIDGMGHDELARVLGVSRKTVERRLARFLDRARDLVRGAA